MTTEIYIVRHGNTFTSGAPVRRIGARTDLPLTEEGRAQAARLAAHFANAGLAFDAAFASPLARTRETADVILAAQSEPPGLEHAAFLKEIDYGPDEGALETAVRDRIGAAALDAWEESATPPPGWLVDPRALTEAWRRFFAAQLEPAPRRVLAVTSNGVARFAVLAAASATPRLKLNTGAYGVIELASGAAPMVRIWNQRPVDTPDGRP